MTFRFWWLVIWGLVAPVAFFIISGGYHGSDMWQSGDFAAYATLLFRLQSMAWLYPLLLFSGYGLIAHFRDAPMVGASGLKLLAVFSGSVLWLEVYVVWCGAVSHELGGAAWVGITFFSPIVGGLTVLAVLGLIFLAVATQNDEGGGPLLVLVCVCIGLLFLWKFVLIGLFICVICAVPLALSAYAWASFELLRSLRQRWRVSIATLLIAFTWLSANFAAWRMAVLAAIDEYNRLPTEPSAGCFVVTAAARGHRRWVGSRDLGQRFAVTHQLQHLKALELLLQTTSPSLHRWLRRYYNRVGPRVARRVRNAWLADGVYVLLKPAEWLAWIAVRVVARVPREVVLRVYRVDR